MCRPNGAVFFCSWQQFISHSASPCIKREEKVSFLWMRLFMFTHTHPVLGSGTARRLLRKGRLSPADMQALFGHGALIQDYCRGKR